MRIVYRPLINMETVLVGSRIENGEVVIDVTVKGKPAQLVLPQADARALKSMLETALFKATAGGALGR